MISGQIVDISEANGGQAQVSIYLSEEVTKRIQKGIPLEVNI